MDYKTTAIVLNWNNLNVSKDTVRRLKKEVPVIVVDNGSTDGSHKYFAEYDAPNVKVILSKHNVGMSLARNLAIDQVKTPYFFLIDGDILYVPKSIQYLEEILDAHTKCGCVGVHNPLIVQRFGHNGVPSEQMADLKAEKPEMIFKGFPMAWTQYGLFRKLDLRMPAMYPFDRAGHGYEDEWYQREMESLGYDTYYIEKPLYYHDAHAGKRELQKFNIPTLEEERRKAFIDKWGPSYGQKHFEIEEVRIT